MAALDNRTLNYCEARFRSGLQLGIKLAFLHVPFGFGKKQGSSGFAGNGDFSEEPAGVGKFVHHSESQREVHRA